MSGNLTARQPETNKLLGEIKELPYPKESLSGLISPVDV